MEAGGGCEVQCNGSSLVENSSEVGGVTDAVGSGEWVVGAIGWK